MDQADGEPLGSDVLEVLERFLRCARDPSRPTPRRDDPMWTELLNALAGS